MNSLIAERNESAITVADLVKALQSQPQDAKVWAEGCDCNNPATGVSIDADGIVSIEVQA